MLRGKTDLSQSDYNSGYYKCDFCVFSIMPDIDS